MEKSVLRKRMIDNMKQLSPTEKKSIEHRLAIQLFQTKLWKNASIIGLTVSQSFEWDTFPIIEEAWKEEKTVAVPKCNTKEKQLTFYKITEYSDLKRGYANILEPNNNESEEVDKLKIQLLIVPGIMFDHFGYRIGFGGGYYDRFLTNFKGDTVSLLSSEQLIDRIPKDSFDIPVTYLVTEHGCRKRVT